MPDDPSDRTGSRAAGATTDNWLTVEVLVDAGAWPGDGSAERLAERAAQALAGYSHFQAHAPATACIALSDSETVRRLNAGYRGKDKPTNVLSFPASAVMSGDGPAASLGDVVLAFEVVVDEARAEGIPFGDHLQHLVVHGLLHLLGFDHEIDADADRMEALEVAVMAGLGVADPYRPISPAVTEAAAAFEE